MRTVDPAPSGAVGARLVTARRMREASVTPLEDFVRESNRIEGIVRDPTAGELHAHRVLLERQSLSRETVQGFVQAVASAVIRDRAGMDVRVGGFVPPPGSPGIGHELEILLQEINAGDLDPLHAHCEYESLHPFTDGNGRSGRAIWAWQMHRDGLDPFRLPFLHRFYYQVLEASRS